MLTSNALERWNEKLTSMTQRETTLPDGTVKAAPGLTEETFKQVKIAWKGSYFDKEAIYTMHEYLRSGIKFPANKGVLVKDWVKRLTEINSKLSRFPRLKTWSSTKKLYLENEELKQIVSRACPVSWQTKLQSPLPG